ncbi:MAG: hypothetical protein ACRDKL_01990, partial [Solirubrobacteraceae bacterium]
MSGPAERRLYDPEAARGPEQRARMARLQDAGVCVFCRDQVSAEQPEPILLEGEHWYVVPNHFPYAGTLSHH